MPGMPAVMETIIFSSFFADSWLQLSVVVGASVAILALLPPLLILTFLYVHLVFLPSPPHHLTLLSPHPLTPSHLTPSPPHHLTRCCQKHRKLDDVESPFSKHNPMDSIPQSEKE